MKRQFLTEQLVVDNSTVTEYPRGAVKSCSVGSSTISDSWLAKENLSGHPGGIHDSCRQQGGHGDAADDASAGHC